ncbi:hypothetical protein DPMN_065336 [Dreissena polymorpha]|uniref:PHD-type domain-containing protein n=1 Tax=Dreissena polymorpha TaxID=45954 RepID=A0A9D4HK80_DREPO|nr:hypothetical protein DPMN_065318 [Dreissena polymorpha]KAH3722378.1 hypothetical protein DPMN_065336 [Dreissena polymorpha]
MTGRSLEDEESYEEETELCCPVCKQETAGTECVVCLFCGDWSHKACLKGIDNNENEYICHYCKFMESERKDDRLNQSDFSLNEFMVHNDTGTPNQDTSLLNADDSIIYFQNAQENEPLFPTEVTTQIVRPN